MSTLFDREKEMGKKGEIYATYGLFGGAPYSEIEKLNQPITPRENLLRYYQGGDYEWIPDTYSDVVDITPAIDPDNIACGYDGGVDSYGVTWEALENGMPAMVRPGNPKLEDIADWKSLTIADVDSWDWEGCAENYQVFDHARFFRGGMPTGLFERLIALLDFEGAAVSLLTQPEDVTEFLDRVTDYNIRLIENFAKYFHVDAVFLSDDWSAQRAPFFSVETARELLLPHVKRMADRAHSLGLSFTLHSCGNGTAFIPLWIEAGVDGWQFQESAVDIEEAIRVADGKLKLEGYWIVPEGLDEEGTRQFIHQTMDRYCRSGQVMAAFCDADYQVSESIRRITYEYGRILRNEMEQEG